MKVNSVNMKFVGSGRVHWSESRGSGRRRKTIHYRNYEEYISLNFVFGSSLKNGGEFYIEPNVSYPFQINLPPNLPTSFEHLHGQIRYSLSGHLDIPWAFDKYVVRSFTVLGTHDLNMNQALRQPCVMSDHKTLCCLCCKSGPIIAKLSLKKGGYVPGEDIFFDASVDNKSSRGLEMSVRLVQLITLHTPRKSRTWERNVAAFKYPKEIDEGKYEEWNGGVLRVPPVCNSSNGTSRCIHVSYSLLLEIDPNGPAVDLLVNIPIMIGTVPLRMDDRQMSFGQPNFQKSLFEASDNKDLEPELKGEVTSMDQNFVPSYAYYKDFSIK
jgi:hypothetical protein